MKLHLIYLMIGITTMLLNIYLTIHMIRGQGRKSSSDIPKHEEVIIFTLKKGTKPETAAATAACYDDTVLLQE